MCPIFKRLTIPHWVDQMSLQESRGTSAANAAFLATAFVDKHTQTLHTGASGPGQPFDQEGHLRCSCTQ
jgi:hypothetical protein